MKFLIVFALCIVAALAAPPTSDITLLKSDFTNDGTNGYSFAFEQSDGHKRDEQGEVKNIGAENEAISVRGSFSFVADDGQTYTVTYVADENGFQRASIDRLIFLEPFDTGKNGIYVRGVFVYFGFDFNGGSYFFCHLSYYRFRWIEDRL